jgi:hypothetical protein
MDLDPYEAALTKVNNVDDKISDDVKIDTEIRQAALLALNDSDDGRRQRVISLINKTRPRLWTLAQFAPPVLGAAPVPAG